MAKFHYLADIITKILDLFKHICTLAFVLAAGWIIFKFFSEALASSPESLTALSKFVKEFKLHIIVQTLVGGGLLGWGTLQRAGRNRAIEKLDEMRKKVEERDKNNQGSGLTKQGGTPRKAKPQKKG